MSPESDDFPVSRQSLSIEGFSCSVILNTHLSQKVQSAPAPATTSRAGPLASARCPPYFLCKTFGRLEAPTTKDVNGAKQVTAEVYFPTVTCQEGSGFDTPSESFDVEFACPPSQKMNLSDYLVHLIESKRWQVKHSVYFPLVQVKALDLLSKLDGSGVLNRVSFSLLEVVEGLGQAGSVGQDVEVVVQRVYATAVPDTSTLSCLKPRVQSGTSCPLPPAETGKTR